MNLTQKDRPAGLTDDEWHRYRWRECVGAENYRECSDCAAPLYLLTEGRTVCERCRLDQERAS